LKTVGACILILANSARKGAGKTAGVVEVVSVLAGKTNRVWLGSSEITEDAGIDYI
jgi:hypothetical protein